MEFTVSREETLEVIARFLDMGHVENIISMFRHDPEYYKMVGELLVDERFNVRLGLMVLFEELITCDNQNVTKSLSSIYKVLQHEEPLYRGEALNLLAIIGAEEALPHIQSCLTDPNPQVREAAEMSLEDIS